MSGPKTNDVPRPTGADDHPPRSARGGSEPLARADSSAVGRGLHVLAGDVLEAGSGQSDRVVPSFLRLGQAVGSRRAPPDVPTHGPDEASQPVEIGTALFRRTPLGRHLVARIELRPARQLTLAIEHASRHTDFHPVAIRHARGDLAALASAFNQLLRTVNRMHERQSRLIADAGHELRTPLTSLSTNVDLLVSDLRSDHLSTTQKGAVLADVRAQLSELTDLVGDLVQLSRHESASTFRPLDLRDAVSAAVGRVRRRAGDRVIDVELEELDLVGDPDALERLVTNLLDNAVKWSPAGSTIRVRLEGNRLRVADAGPGIPEADLPYVFDRFFRGETARKTHGTGLGLSIVAKTVEDHGGTVTAGRSSEGGAEFTVQLPGVTHWEALPSLLVPKPCRGS